MNACCTGSSLPGSPRCSTVTTSVPSRKTARRRQPDTGRPSTTTVQQPHRPCPQLSRAPNNANCVCSISTTLWCGFTSATTDRPFSVKLIVFVAGLISFVPEWLVVSRTQRAEHCLRSQRQFGEAHADSIVDGVSDRRRYTEGAEFADTLGAEWAVALIGVDCLVLHYRGHIANARNLVVGERGIGNLAAVNM